MMGVEVIRITCFLVNGLVHCILSDGPIKLLVKKILLFSCERKGSLYLLWLAWLPLELLVRKKETSVGI